MHIAFHCFNLIANYATIAIPDRIESLIREIYNHFSYSALHTSQWKEFQVEMDLRPYKIMSFGQTRWSSLEFTVNRIFMRWETLIRYFEEVANEDCSTIIKRMKKANNLVYMKILAFYLQKISNLSKKFQTNVTQVTTLHSDIIEFHNSIMNCVLKTEHRNLSIDKQLTLLNKIKEMKTIKIKTEYARSLVSLWK